VASSSIIAFPRPIRTRSATPVLSALTPAASVSTLRYRGLRLVTTAQEPLSERAKSGRIHSQAQADRIVAQVEREIALKAIRQRQAQINGHAPKSSTSATLYTLPIAEAETAASVARRLFAALLSFARPA
jgi:hypothetical protein